MIEEIVKGIVSKNNRITLNIRDHLLNGVNFDNVDISVLKKYYSEIISKYIRSDIDEFIKNVTSRKFKDKLYGFIKNNSPYYFKETSIGINHVFYNRRHIVFAKIIGKDRLTVYDIYIKNNGKEISFSKNKAETPLTKIYNNEGVAFDLDLFINDLVNSLWNFYFLLCMNLIHHHEYFITIHNNDFKLNKRKGKYYLNLNKKIDAFVIGGDYKLDRVNRLEVVFPEYLSSEYNVIDGVRNRIESLDDLILHVHERINRSWEILEKMKHDIGWVYNLKFLSGKNVEISLTEMVNLINFWKYFKMNNVVKVISKFYLNDDHIDCSNPNMAGKTLYSIMNESKILSKVINPDNKEKDSYDDVFIYGKVSTSRMKKIVNIAVILHNKDIVTTI